MVEKHLKKCSMSLVTKEINVNQMIPRFHLTPLGMAKKLQEIPYSGKDVEKGEHSSIVGGSANLYNHSGNPFDNCSEN